ncbi:MAG TPA: winged helix DNA-binding domain-containing protein, partial [Ktedonobacterales bacterium]|nr:winged helix DNA-binding domain-containing protein [Ktedonobacterales bacterium]
MRSLTWREVWGWRLTRHGLLAPKPEEDLVEVVRAVCGIHAQVMSAAELSIGVRLASGTRQDVREALWQRRSLVKMHGLRGTVHLFPADEFPLWLAAFRANPQPNEAQWLAQMGLEVAQRDAIAAAIGEALDGQRLTREDLGREVAQRVGSWASEAVSPAFGGQWPRWQMAIGAAFTAGLLCFGPNEGNKVTFVRPDQWLGGWVEMDGEEALREVFRRYLSAYGPATHRDFAQWFGMPPSRALAVMQGLSGELEEVDVEGYRPFLLQSDAAKDFPLAPDVV